MSRSQFDKSFLKTRVLKTLTNVYFRAKKHFHKQFLCFSGRTNNRKYLNFFVMLKVTPRDHTVFLGKRPFALSWASRTWYNKNISFRLLTFLFLHLLFLCVTNYIQYVVNFIMLQIVSFDNINKWLLFCLHSFFVIII